MSAGRTGVGVIGAGVISAQYLANLTTFPDVEVLFVADIDLDRARERAAEFGVPASGTVDELLAVVADSGAESSLGLHASLGFKETGRMGKVGQKFGRWIGTVMLQKTIK